MESNKFYVIKRNGTKETISFDKILTRIQELCKLQPELTQIDPALIAQETIQGMYFGISTERLDILAASIAQPKNLDHPEYGVLASRLLVSNHHKTTLTNLQKHWKYKYGIILDLETIEKNLLYYTFTCLFENLDQVGEQHPLVCPPIYQFIMNNLEKLARMVDYSRDYQYDYLGFQLLETSYLQKSLVYTSSDNLERLVIERPQDLILRVSLGIHLSQKYQDFNKMKQSDKLIFEQVRLILEKYFSPEFVRKIEKKILTNSVDWKNLILDLKDKNPESEDLLTIIRKIGEFTKTWNQLREKFPKQVPDSIWFDIQETYDFMSRKLFTHATPTLFNSGTLKPQLSSCFLLQIPGDSMEGITKFWSQCAQISKFAGGIGSHIHNIRARGSYIRGTNGTSNGLVPMLKCLNDQSVYVDQCFHPATLVFTKNGMKKIKHVLLNEKILTHSGNFEKISKINHYPSEIRELIELNTGFNIGTIKLTAKHPVLAIKWDREPEELKKLIESGFIEPDWIEAGELNPVQYYLVSQIPEFYQDLNWNLDECYIYGLILQWGIISDSEITLILPLGVNAGISLFLENYLTELGGMELKIQEIKSGNEKNINLQLSWERNQYFPFIRKHFYNNSEKFVHPDFMFLPEFKTRRILEGIFLDYSVRKIMPENKIIGESIKYLLIRFPDIKISFKIEQNYLILEDLENPKEFFRIKNRVYSKIQYFKYSDYPKNIVVDFEVQNTPSYQTQAVLAHNGGNKRPGSHVVYLEPWHADILDFLQLRKSRGSEMERARNLFYAVWLPDEFMRTIEQEFELEKKLRKELPAGPDLEKKIKEQTQLWYLFCPDKLSSVNLSNLSNLYDQKLSKKWLLDSELDPENFKFTYYFRKYIQEGLYSRKISAIEIWKSICELIEETGLPYVSFKDSVNRKSNQKNLGTIKSSNLCQEIVQYSSREEIAVCNLCSINLGEMVLEKPRKIRPELKLAYLDWIDWTLLEKVVRRCVRNLNRIIDINFYPLPETEYSNLKNRPMGIGVQDFAHFLTKLEVPFNSPEAYQINFYLFEFIYYICLDQSCLEAQEFRQNKIDKLKLWLNRALVNGDKSEEKYNQKKSELDNLLKNTLAGSYNSYSGSPVSLGKLHFDLWIEEQLKLKYPLTMNWDKLKNEQIKCFGIRNSQLVALMPTGSTSTILGSTPCFEPYNGLVIKRRNKTGENTIVDRLLQKSLLEKGLWTKKIINKLLSSSKGSIQEIEEIPENIRKLYLTVWDLTSREMADMTLGRSSFIDQATSDTVFMKKPNIRELTQLHFYKWRLGAKSSSYYTRRLAVIDAQKIQLEDEKEEKKEEEGEEKEGYCTMSEGCKSCSS